MQRPLNKPALLFILLCILILTGGYFWYHRYTSGTMTADQTSTQLEKGKKLPLNVDTIIPLQEAVKIDEPKKYKKIEPLPKKTHLVVPASDNPIPPSSELQVVSSKLKQLKKPSTTEPFSKKKISSANSQTLKKFEAETGISGEEIQKALNQ